MKHLFLALALALLCLRGSAQQLEIQAETIACTDIEDHDGNSYGSGSLFKLSARGNANLSMSIDSLRRPTVWNLAGRATYGHLANHGQARTLYPDQMLNAGVNLTHIRPLRGRWSLMAMAGVGLYTTIDELAWRDLLVNAGLIFCRTVNPNLTIGVGAALTNTYGAPMILPIPYVRWTCAGRFEFGVNMIGLASVWGAMKIDDRLKLNLDFFEIESLSAVRRMNHHTYVVGMTGIRSAIRPEWLMGQSSLSLSVGVEWNRSLRSTKRDWSGFFHTFNRNNRRTFNPAPDISLAYSYKFR